MNRLTSTAVILLLGVQAVAALTPLAPFDDQGVPTNLLGTREVYSETFRQQVMASLPEYKQLPDAHPEFLDPNAKRSIEFVAPANVQISFVHEGAGYRNVGGVFTFDPANPPSSPAEISTRTVAFPNASFAGSGGGLTMGDTVDLGTFQPGEALGFFLAANGFKYNPSRVTEGNWVLYSIDDLNPEADAADRIHTILLQDPDQGRFVIGFEDIRRDYGSCDHDFNDLILSVQVTPYSAVDVTDVPLLVEVSDRDQDGMPDDQDEFPDDPTRAFQVDSPAPGVDGTLAYEDLWPAKGDFDFNDLVVSYHVTQYRDAAGRVVEAALTYEVLAAGAAYSNGLRVAFPLDPSALGYATLQLDDGTPASIFAAGDQSQLTFQVFDDAHDLITAPPGYSYANTQVGSPAVVGQVVTLRVTFATPQDPAALGAAPFDTYLARGGVEVHLPGFQPSDTMDLALIRTIHDGTRLDTPFTFKSWEGLPWALHVPVRWEHPAELIAIDQGYPTFVTWAESSGTLYPDWYTTPAQDDSIWRPTIDE